MSFTALDCLFWGVAALGLVGAVRSTRAVVALQLLPESSPKAALRLRVSVVIAARDEEARIETTVRRLLAQENVDLELVVVNDRSTDSTGAILARLAASDARLRVDRIDELPAGWLGKCHACHVGASRATSEWLLFTDGDVWLKPDVVARAVRQAEIEEVDHVTLIPGVSGATFLGSVGLLLFNVGFARRADAVNRDVSGTCLGFGAFNLVRASAYRSIGGHEPLRMEIVDDVKLSLLLRRSGRRSRVYFAPRDADVDWCPGPRAMVNALEKNHFAITGYRTWLVAIAATFFVAFWGAGLVGPWTGTPAGIAAGLGLMGLAIPAVAAARRLGRPLAAGLFVPLFLPLFAVCLVNSTVRTLRRGGVRWRDTFYPLAALRAGSVR